MAKPNTYVLLHQARQENLLLQENLRLSKGMTIQQSIDMMDMMLGEGFDFSPEDIDRAERLFRRIFVEFCQLCLEDGADDEEIWYTKGLLDRRLAAVKGGKILPFDDRYANERLYFRDYRHEWAEEGEP